MLNICKAYSYKMVVLALAGTTLFFGCTADIEMVNALTEQENTPGVSSVNSTMTYTESGIVKIKVFAPKTFYYQFAEEPYSEFPDGISVYTYADSTTIESQLTSNYAIYYDKKQLWVARNNVVAMNKKGDILNTEELFWDEAKKEIYSNDNVKVTTADGVIFGKGFVSDERFVNWRIKKMSGSFYVDEEN